VFVQLEIDHDMTDDSNDGQQQVLGRTAPVSYVLMSGGFPQHATVAHSAPNELLKGRQKMSSPLSLGDRASTTTSISEV